MKTQPTINIWRSQRDMQWRVVISRNGRILLSSEGYQRKTAALRMIVKLCGSLRDYSPVPSIIDTTV